MQGNARAFALLIALFTAGSAAGQGAGTFARMGFGARGMAMGNATVADVSGFASPYYNPALAPYITTQNLELSAAALTLDRQLQFVQLATPLKPRAGLAAGLIHAGVRNIDGRDGSGYHTGYLSTDEYAFMVAFGLRLGNRASIGVGIGLFRSQLLENVPAVRTIGLDLGLSIRATETLSFGAAMDDLLAEYTWDTSGIAGSTTADPFPLRLRVGTSYLLSRTNLLLALEYESLVNRSQVSHRTVELIDNNPREVFTTEELRIYDNRLNLGAEMMLSPIFVVRGGVSRLVNGSIGATRPSAGLMIEQELGALLIHAEYTFLLEPFALGTMHVLSLRVFL